MKMRVIQQAALLAMGMAIMGTGANAQSMQPTPIGQVAKQEQMHLSTVRVGNAIVRPPILDLYAICQGAAKDVAALVDVDGDRRPDVMRFYGGALATRLQWEKIGPSLLAPLRRIAEMRAQAQVAKTVSVYVAVSEDTSDSYSDNKTSTLNDLSEQTNTDTLSSSSIRSKASAYLKGARVTNVKVVSLGPKEGICVVVRYDVPLDGNRLGSSSRPYYNDEEPEPVTASPEEDDGYTLPAPGVSSY